MTHWQVDSKDVLGSTPETEGKKQHGIQALHLVDMGMSLVVDAQVQANFTAETTLQAIVESFQKQGRPATITVDRDAQLVGSPQGCDFPSALLRFRACLGVEVEVCDPRHSQQNGFVERDNRSSQAECLLVERPQTPEQAKQATALYGEHSNTQRPHQALSCGNRLPRTAFPDLPQLPSVPGRVDPDAWLLLWHGHHFQRTVNAKGSVKLDLKQYGVGHQWRGQRVAVTINAPEHQSQIWAEV